MISDASLDKLFTQVLGAAVTKQYKLVPVQAGNKLNASGIAMTMHHRQYY